MKKLRVLCLAGPKSSKCPRPIPSSCQRNSFRPFDCRAALESAPTVVWDLPAVATATAELGPVFPAGDGRCGVAGSCPGRILLKKFISITVFRARLHGYRMGDYRHVCGRLGSGAGVIFFGIVRTVDFNSAVNLCALSDGNTQC